MKKLFTLALIMLLLTACSKDDSSSCEQKVWGISVGNNTYLLSVGPKGDNVEFISCSQAVANYYAGRLSANERCYDGLNVGY